MKLKSIIGVCSITLSSMAMAGSYQYGSVSELIIKSDSVTFQLDTADGIDIRDGGCTGEQLNFVIDFKNQLAAKAMLDVVLESKRNGNKLGVNGSGNCQYDFEKVDTIAR